MHAMLPQGAPGSNGVGTESVGRTLATAVEGATDNIKNTLRAMIDHIKKQEGWEDNRAMRQDVNRLYSSLDHLNRLETDKW